jgi:PKD repeat protein
MMKKRILAFSGMVILLLITGCAPRPLLPIADFTASPATGISPLVVTFDASGSQSPNGPITEYAWFFGDGSAGIGVTVAHLYQTDEERIFTVTLQIIDHLGERASMTDEVTVHAPAEDSGEPSVEFVWPFHYNASGDDAANLNDEYFTLQNTGDEAIDLSGWTVENERGVSFRIPNGIVLAPNAMITIHSGSGRDTASVLYWNASEPVWNNTYDLAVLRDAEGKIVDYDVDCVVTHAL